MAALSLTIEDQGLQDCWVTHLGHSWVMVGGVSLGVSHLGHSSITVRRVRLRDPPTEHSQALIGGVRLRLKTLALDPDRWGWGTGCWLCHLLVIPGKWLGSSNLGCTVDAIAVIISACRVVVNTESSGIRRVPSTKLDIYGLLALGPFALCPGTCHVPLMTVVCGRVLEAGS